ncbi:SPFH domain-containing protein [Candidatus Nomurabacteria bacterium]|nr:SPFH domain-containing protein [Candidatus Nomurabacteria bacterium]
MDTGFRWTINLKKMIEFLIWILNATTWILLVIALIALLNSSLVQIPVAHYGNVIRLGKRLERSVREGYQFKLPFLEKFLLIKQELKTLQFKKPDPIKIFSIDNLQITLEGSIQYRYDFNNLRKIPEIEPETIKKGMLDSIEDSIGIIGSEEKGEDFRQNKEIIGQMINCVLRMERPPHYYVIENDPNDFNNNPSQSFLDYLERLRNAKISDQKLVKQIDHLEAYLWEIPLKSDNSNLNILEFYLKNKSRIETMLQLEDFLFERSATEILYNLDVRTFKLTSVDFSTQVTEALEAEEVMKKEIIAKQKRQDAKIKIMEELIAKGVSPDKASDDADVMLGIAKKNIVSGGNAFNVLNNNS